MALSKGIWDPRPKLINIKGANLKSLIRGCVELFARFKGSRVVPLRSYPEKVKVALV